MVGTATPLGVEHHFHRGYLRPSENTNIYITFHDSSKLQLGSSNENSLKVGVTTT